MPIVTTRCVVLQTYRYSDTSKILRLVTREHGPRSAIAKGALRPGSRFGGVLEPFAEGEATLYLKPDRDLHTLSEFDLIRERQSLGVDLNRFAGASVACELVMRLAPEERDPRLYRTLLAGLDALTEAAPEEVRSLALMVNWQIVRVLGFHPEMDRCAGCGRELEAGGETRFDFAAGGLACPRCATSGPRLGEREREELAGLLEGRPPPGAPGARQARFLRDFIRYHLAEGIHLRSLDFLDAEALA